MAGLSSSTNSSSDSGSGAGAAGRREWKRLDWAGAAAGSSNSGWLGGGRARSSFDTDKTVNRFP